MALSVEFPIFECLISCNNHLNQNLQIQILLLTFPVCVPNTGDNDVMFLTSIKLTSKTGKETQCLELIILVNPCKIYVYINNKAVILLLMAIYNKNQASTVS